MKNYVGRIVLLVTDYEKSASFYETNFGFTRIFDQTTTDGQRFLHLGIPGGTMGIWLLKAATDEQRKHVGNQTAGQPTLVIYTSDIDGLHRRLKNNGVRLKTEIVRTRDYAFLHCYDLDGNELIVTELKESV